MTTSPNFDPTTQNDSASNDRRTLLAGLGLLTAGALLTRKAQAGPLNPPAGPVISTGKTLTEVEPRIPINSTNTPGTATAVFAITQPGSYYLTGNIQGEAGKNGIEISVQNVTLDLNGFTLQGVAGALGGISVTQALVFSVFNGIVSGFTRGLIAVDANPSALLKDLMFYENTSAGASVNGATITRCRFVANGGSGCQTSGTVFIDDCVSHLNGQAGFSSVGITYFSNCVSVDNGEEGFACSGNAHFANCFAQGNSAGFQVIGSASLIDCFASDSTQSGIELVDSNASSIVRGCTARFNGQNGILVNSGVVVQGNTLFRNGASRAGIRVTGSDNRIEGNNCIRAGLGIEVVGTGNFISRNTCSGNTTANYSIVAGNAVATIFSANNNATAINGSTYTGSLGSPDPNANFSY